MPLNVYNPWPPVLSTLNPHRFARCSLAIYTSLEQLAAAMDPSQQGSWDDNVYFVTTTRIFMALGLTFLVRSVYQLYQRMRSAGGNAGATGKSHTLTCYWKGTLADCFQWPERVRQLGSTLRLWP